MQSHQISVSQAEYAKKKKTTRCEAFLEKMEHLVPWAHVVEVIEPYYPKRGGRGRPPIGIERMLRMSCLQQWYGLADEAVEDAVYDSQALASFMGIDRSRESVPDASTLMGFRHLLEENDVTKGMLFQAARTRSFRPREHHQLAKRVTCERRVQQGKFSAEYLQG